MRGSTVDAEIVEQQSEQSIRGRGDFYPASTGGRITLKRKPGPRRIRARGVEQNTGFEPATFALATRQPAIHDSPLPFTNQQESAISLGSSEGISEAGSTNLHEDSRSSCVCQGHVGTQRVHGSTSPK